MTPSRLITIFKTITEYKEGVFFAGITAEFLRAKVESEGSKGKTFVVIDLQGFSVKENLIDQTSSYKFNLLVVKQDNPDSVSQSEDNKGEYDDIQTICLDCYNFWMDILQKLRADISSNADYLSTYFQEISVSISDAKYFIKPKLLGLMSGIMVSIEAEGRTEC